MSKAVLVMEMPECCADCRLSDNDRGGLYCFPTDKFLNGYDSTDEKPDWCPLRTLPLKRTAKGMDGINAMFMDERIRQGINEAGAFGWKRKRIDRILKIL